ncbi:helix-turn-helix transcriptional regulator [Nocardioides mangrovi]|uniref:AAA family ATPase n=1 Tax=Nocardioides mangrovi TaxID=2874580 RepID=A0ABS7UBW3_9ACTN|nr:LuxR family transcriptional regulator [Nocardioides mangrovi]MBZ5738272.1 AAA family ATPase [Nocardioides mangrovi]
MGPASRLIGRSAELDQLMGVLRGDVRALVVEGDAGVGKTALLDDISRRARSDGWSVVRYQCAEAEQDFPHAVLERILRPLGVHAHGLPSHQRDAVEIILGHRIGDAPSVIALGTATLNVLVQASAEMPRMVVVDDAQWMDSASGEVLMFVARRLSDAPVALLQGVRSGETTDLDFGGVEHLELPALDPASSAELLDFRHPDLARELRAEVLRWAVGNPLALTELPASFASSPGAASRGELPLPRRLEQVYVQRLATLSEDERFALLLLALDGVASDEIEFDLVHRLDGARVAGLVDVGAVGRAAFRHPLVRSAVVSSAPAEQRRAAHLRLADVRTGDPLRRAHHLASATTSPDEAAAGDIQKGAEHAIRRGGAAVAVRLLTRAAALSEDPDNRERRLAEAAYLATFAGLLDEADTLLGRLDRLTGDLGSPPTVIADGYLQLIRDGAVVPTHRSVLGAIRRHGRDIDDETLSRLADLLLAVSMYSADPLLWEQTEEALDEQVDRLRPLTLLVRDVGGDLLRHAEDARDRVAEAFTWPEHSPMDVTLLALCAYFVDSLGEHRSFVERMIEREVEAGSRTDVMTLLQLTLLDDTVRGRWDEAAHTFARGMDLNTGLGRELDTNLFRAFYARVLAQRGDVAGASRLGAAVDLWARPRGVGVLLHHVECAALAGALAIGAYDDAWTHALGVISPGSFGRYAHESYRCVVDVVEAALATGHVDEARRHAQGALDHGLPAVSPRMELLCTAALAMTDLTADADRLFTVATGHRAAPSFPFDLARIRLAHGRWLRRQGDLRRARVVLSPAVEAFEGLGSAPWAERASRELSLTGASGDETADRRALLTQQELHIAELAASGLTNKQIGAQLYLSPRTVSTHLYRIFPKLGVTSRASLRDALAREVTGGPRPS